MFDIGNGKSNPSSINQGSLPLIVLISHMNGRVIPITSIFTLSIFKSNGTSTLVSVRLTSTNFLRATSDVVFIKNSVLWLNDSKLENLVEFSTPPFRSNVGLFKNAEPMSIIGTVRNVTG